MKNGKEMISKKIGDETQTVYLELLNFVKHHHLTMSTSWYKINWFYCDNNIRIANYSILI